ncbi:protein-export chaperone SecB [Pseudohongiella sp.]|uniref:Protein-export protein SecB n=1 Tax=marine sediment metagenome TaxID=412755 RepID=A0A0F9YIQ4_9ZZZZ|nr:protein-export chaperone SecB [Pseudohongiella sp.]HDZ09332.1 protein-export chaperone SecB [Pseudohongiella sp.]HEA63819.1 protein-export chaperone SecB [Pseudohongiella sp.]
MAENENNQNGNAAAAQGDQQQGPMFALQRIYLKDTSFESPKSPDVFKGQWAPKITFNLNTSNEKLADGVYNVVLRLTIEAKQEDAIAFLVEVQQAGIFTLDRFNEGDLERALATVCPNILFPYARETIDALVVRGSFPPVMLAPVNFDAVYAQSKAQKEQQDQAAPQA